MSHEIDDAERRNAELREWLGIKLADLLVYTSLASTIAMFFVKNDLADLVLASLSVLASIIACPIGMKRDPKVSDFTNTIKLITYIPLALLIFAAIAVHYWKFR